LTVTLCVTTWRASTATKPVKPLRAAILAIQVAEVAGRRSPRVVDQDVGFGTGGQDPGAAFVSGNVAGDGSDDDSRLAADLVGGRFKHVRTAGVDHQVHAFAGQCQGASSAHSRGRGTDDGLAASDTEIHGNPLEEWCLLRLRRSATRQAANAVTHF
jgi:hypothetical protein